MPDMTRTFGRRSFLSGLGLVAVPILAACGGAAPTNTPAPAAKPTEAPKSAAAAPTTVPAAATTAPAAAATKPAAAATTGPAPPPAAAAAPTTAAAATTAPAKPAAEATKPAAAPAPTAAPKYTAGGANVKDVVFWHVLTGPQADGMTK